MRDEVGAATLRRMIAERDQAVAALHGMRGEVKQCQDRARDLMRFLATCARMIIDGAEAKRLAQPEESRPPATIKGIRLPFDKIEAVGSDPVLYINESEEARAVFIQLEPFPGQEVMSPEGPATPTPGAPENNGRRIILLP